MIFFLTDTGIDIENDTIPIPMLISIKIWIHILIFLLILIRTVAHQCVEGVNLFQDLSERGVDGLPVHASNRKQVEQRTACEQRGFRTSGEVLLSALNTEPQGQAWEAATSLCHVMSCSVKSCHVLLSSKGGIKERRDLNLAIKYLPIPIQRRTSKS